MQAEIQTNEQRVRGQIATYPDVLTIREVAEILKVSDQTVYQWTWAGALPVIRLADAKRAVRVRRDDLEEFIGGRIRTA